MIFADPRVKAHVAVCVIAYLIESLLEKAFDWAGMKLTARKALEQLAPLKVAGLDEFSRIVE